MKRTTLVIALLLPLCAAALAAGSAGSDVVINGVRLDEPTLRALAQQHNLPIPPGDYWYDRISGAWGYAGGPTVGYTIPHLKVGGRLRSDASRGTTGVFVNGRQLHVTEVLAISRLVGLVYPGRYWFDARGNYGFEGYPALGNLWVMARNAGGGGRGEGILSTYDKVGATVIGGDLLSRD